MRRLVATIAVFGALLLIAASAVMNWSFWTGQGPDKPTSHVLGAVSIGVDIFKALLPLIVAWSWGAKFRLGFLIGTVFFVGCLAFSFFSAVGFAASSRGAVTGGREAVSLRYAAAGQELRETKDRLTAIPAARPQALIEAALAKAKQDRRWPSSKECTDATVDPSRQFCKEVADLRIELAAVIEADRLRERAKLLQAEIDRLIDAGAKLDQDPQAGLLARITGLQLERVQTILTVLLALLVELGAAFGLFLALLPLKAASIMSPALKPIVPVVARIPRTPTRFVRAPDGELMIE